MEDSLFARSQRRGLSDTLSLDEIVGLSTCSLDNPNGVTVKGHPLLNRLQNLIRCGLVTPARTEGYMEVRLPLLMPSRTPVNVTSSPAKRYYVHRSDLCPHVESLGDIGPELLKWLNSGAQPSGNSADLDEQSGENAGDDYPSEWAVQWLNDHWPLTRVLAGAELSGELAELIQGSELKFSARTLVDGIKDYDPGSVPNYSSDELARNLKLLYPSFLFLEKRASCREEMIRTISRCYEQTERRVQEDCVTKLPQNVRHLLKSAA